MTNDALTSLAPDEWLYTERPRTGLVGERRAETQSARPQRPFSFFRQALVGDAARGTEFREAIARIKGFRDLPENWDTYHGLPASADAVRFSVELLEILRSVPEIPPPFVSPISTGVFLQWRFGENQLYFEVDKDSVLFAMREGQTEIEAGEDAWFDVDSAIALVKRFHHAEEVAEAEGLTQGTL